jgi:undecaprenyl phosphate-alpha-L-ara4N flippase subunit ArnE
LFLAGGQVCLKFAMARMIKFSLTWTFIANVLTNWYLLASGICMALATVLWLYLMKHFAFSVIYPMISISYIFGMLAAIYIFHETIPMTRWLGVLLIMAGIVLIAK